MLFLKVNFLIPIKAPPNEIGKIINTNKSVFVLDISMPGLPITARVFINSKIKLD